MSTTEPLQVTPSTSHLFMGASATPKAGTWTLLGLPFDSTCSYRPGTRFGPGALREASWGLETYSPLQDKDLEDYSFSDVGDLDLPFGNTRRTLDMIEAAAAPRFAARQKVLSLGGEHLVSYPLIKAALATYPDLKVVQFDAHADLRESYMDEPLSHACVMRRVLEHLQSSSFVQVGIRSGTKEEFASMREEGFLLQSVDELAQRIAPWLQAGDPIYITIDLDVLDPSILPGTGTPEPGGLMFNELMAYLMLFKQANLVGADAVELSPHYDASGVSNIVAAKVVRELLLLTH